MNYIASDLGLYTCKTFSITVKKTFIFVFMTGTGKVLSFLKTLILALSSS